MEKEQIKKQVFDAIERDPAKDIIRRAYLFGSYLHGTPKNSSDVDILVEFQPSAKIGLFGFVRLQRRISDSIGRKVDLLTPASLSKFFREKITSEAEIIYEGR